MCPHPVAAAARPRSSSEVPNGIPRVGGERFQVDIQAFDDAVRRDAMLAQQVPQTRQRSGSLISDRSHDCRHGRATR